MRKYPDIKSVMPKVGDIIETHYSGVYTYVIVTSIINSKSFECEYCDRLGVLLNAKYNKQYKSCVWDIENPDYAPISIEKYECDNGSNTIIGNIYK